MFNKKKKIPNKNVVFFLFLFGGFLGWIIDTVYRTLTSGFFQEGGFLSHSLGFLMPFLPVYGFGLVIIYLFCEKNLSLFVRFIFLATVLSVLELIAGLTVRFILGYDLWLYQGSVFYFTDFTHGLYWGLLGIVAHVVLHAKMRY